MKKVFASSILFLFFCLSAYGVQNIFEILNEDYLVDQDFLEILNEDSMVDQGGTLVLRLRNYVPKNLLLVHAFDRFYGFDNQGFAYIGVDFETVRPEYYPVNLISSITKKTDEFYILDFFGVRERKFPESQSPVSPKALSKKESEKRKKEGAMIQTALRSGRPEDAFMDSSFVSPLDKNEKTGEFGVKRLYKKEIIGRHRGTDLRANSGSSVYAINAGKVVLAGKFSLEGNMVVLYHGLGIYSMYMHLSKTKVKEGTEVKTGQLIGLSGKTGRVTGPHLHFAIKVNGATVDPLEFIETVNKLKK